MANNVYTGPAAAMEGLLFEGMTIMCGGFDLCCNPEGLIPEIRRSGSRNLPSCETTPEPHDERVNPKRWRHPLGMSGARLVMTAG